MGTSVIFSVYLYRYFRLTKPFLFDINLNNRYAACYGWVNMKAVYPGSFDPITNGHVDIIHRGLKIFEQIVIAVLKNPKKNPLFATKERVAMIKEIFKDQENIEVQAFEGLLVDFAKKNEAGVVMRGLRAISDFEYEFQMALMNRKLDAEIETLFMMPSVDYSFLSSNLVKEVSMLGGCLQGLVPPLVEKQLVKKFGASKKLT